MWFVWFIEIISTHQGYIYDRERYDPTTTCITFIEGVRVRVSGDGGGGNENQVQRKLWSPKLNSSPFYLHVV